MLDLPLKQDLWQKVEKRSHLLKWIMTDVDHMTIDTRPCDDFCVTEKSCGPGNEATV